MKETEFRYHPRGAALEVFRRREPEILLSGPAGTGKSRAGLEKVHRLLVKYPGARALMLRKTLNSLTSSGLVTYREKILLPQDGVRFFSGNKQKPAQFEYPVDRETGEQSVFVVGGMDNATKVMSTEYDVIFVQEAIELSITDWENCTTRLRNNRIPYQQIIADCNPDSPHHWLKHRVDLGKTLMLFSRHEDNPTLFDRDGALTPNGVEYMAKLDNLTGIRLQRLRHGRWVAAEGIVYENYDRTIHLINEAELPRYMRYVVGVDWGFTNPGVLSVWGVDGDGRMYLVEEVYMTGQLMDWWLEHAIRINTTYHPEAFICDPAEPALIAQFLSAGLLALPGFNEIRPGIIAAQERFQRSGDGRPRIFITRDALAQIDQALADKKKPLCLDQEMDSYVWPEGVDGRPLKEKPIDEHNHALDAMRYVVCYLDHIGEVAITGNRTAVSGPRPQLFQQR